jgi:hypothetical protein
MNKELKQNGFYYANFLKIVDGENRQAFIVVFIIEDYVCLDITPTEEQVKVDTGLIEHIKKWKSFIKEAIKDGSIESQEAKEKFAKLNTIRNGVYEGVFSVSGLDQKLILTSAFHEISASLESKGFRPLLGKEITNTIFSGLSLNFQEIDMIQVVKVDENPNINNAHYESLKSAIETETITKETFFDKYGIIIMTSLVILMFIWLFSVLFISNSSENKNSENNMNQLSINQQSVSEKDKIKMVDSISLILKMAAQDSINQATKHYEDSLNQEVAKARERILAEQEKNNAELRKTSIYMDEYSEDFPLEYNVPSCPNQLQGSTPAVKCWLVVYYAKPGNQNWQEVGGTIIAIKGGIDNTFHFFGRKGWKYAYSWDAGNTRPIKLKPVNVKRNWNTQ